MKDSTIGNGQRTLSRINKVWTVEVLGGPFYLPGVPILSVMQFTGNIGFAWHEFPGVSGSFGKNDYQGPLQTIKDKKVAHVKRL